MEEKKGPVFLADEKKVVQYPAQKKFICSLSLSLF